MDLSDLPHRVSQNPREITNPKTPEGAILDEWEEKVKTARKVSIEATALFQDENLKEPCTPEQRMRVYSAKIDELDAHARLQNCEAEHLSNLIETKKHERSEDDEDTIAELLEQLRKRRRTSSEHTKKALALRSERATFLESTSGSTALRRAELLENILLGPTKLGRRENDRRSDQNSWKQKLVEFFDAGNPDCGRTVEDFRTGVEFIRYSELWCPVFQTYMPSDRIIAAHLAPKSLGTAVISYLTGTDLDTTMLLGNGILLSDTIEAALDRGSIAIIPAGNI
jgi:hypothetical protein